MRIGSSGVIALTFGRFGLVDIGIEGARRGLALIDAKGDEEDLRHSCVELAKTWERLKPGGGSRRSILVCWQISARQEVQALPLAAGSEGFNARMTH